MKALLALCLLFASNFAMAENYTIPQDGRWYQVGGHNVTCGQSIAPTQRVYICTAGFSGKYVSSRQSDVETARSEAMRRCDRQRGSSCGVTSCRGISI